MAKPPVPNTIKAAVVYRQSDQECVNTLAFTVPVTPGVGDAQQVANALLAAWIEFVMPVLSQSCALVRVESIGLQGAGSPKGEAAADPGTVGGFPFLAKDNQQATVISLRTGLSGRSFRGRLFVPGVPENEVNASRINLAYRTIVAQKVYQALLEMAANGAGQAVVVSYQANNVPRAVPITTPINNVLSVTAYVGSANRRRPT